MTAAATARLKLATNTTPGLPKLPHIPEAWSDCLTPEQQEENLLHVALWIVEHDQDNLEMFYWHKITSKATAFYLLSAAEQHQSCGTAHCIAGFAQVMSGEVGFKVSPQTAGYLLLGKEAVYHFVTSNTEALIFLKTVIARNS
jgi:hypothetical protein